MVDFDLAIVGGGINGTGIARDAAGRGLRVSWSSRATSHPAPRPRRPSSSMADCATSSTDGSAWCARPWLEREVILRMAPHLVRPMRFVLPCRARHAPGLDAASGTPASTIISVGASYCRRRAQPRSRAGSARRAARASSRARFRVFRLLGRRCTARGAQCGRRRRAWCGRSHPHALHRRPSGARHWRLVLDVRGRRDVATARVLVNATGPWLGRFAAGRARRPEASPGSTGQGQPHRGAASVRPRPRLHIPALGSADRFCAAVRGDFTLIGTTDRSFDGIRAVLRWRRRDRLSVCCRQPVFPRRHRPRRRPVVVRRGARPPRRRLRQGAGRQPRLLCSRSTSAPAPPRC